MAGWLAKRFGGPFRVAMIGFIVMIGSLVLSLGDVWMLIAQVFVMCLGMFVIHTLAASEVNHNARSLGGVVNGLYVSCYYAGGALGAGSGGSTEPNMPSFWFIVVVTEPSIELTACCCRLARSMHTVCAAAVSATASAVPSTPAASPSSADLSSCSCTACREAAGRKLLGAEKEIAGDGRDYGRCRAM